jgi:hypothetical protein
VIYLENAKKLSENEREKGELRGENERERERERESSLGEKNGGDENQAARENLSSVCNSVQQNIILRKIKGQIFC